ncbi:hypothetical protein T01_13166, partial [Trichinella spiralis]
MYKYFSGVENDRRDAILERIKTTRNSTGDSGDKNNGVGVFDMSDNSEQRNKDNMYGKQQICS